MDIGGTNARYHGDAARAATQLTGEPLTAKVGATPESQLTALKDASAGKRWLVVLDDVWDSSHEKLLNCVDDSTPSTLFVTTRIRGLLKGCDEISLELLTCDAAVDLLLRTGGVEGSEARSYAAQSCSCAVIYHYLLA